MLCKDLYCSGSNKHQSIKHLKTPSTRIRGTEGGDDKKLKHTKLLLPLLPFWVNVHKLYKRNANHPPLVKLPGRWDVRTNQVKVASKLATDEPGRTQLQHLVYALVVDQTRNLQPLMFNREQRQLVHKKMLNTTEVSNPWYDTGFRYHLAHLCCTPSTWILSEISTMSLPSCNWILSC